MLLSALLVVIAVGIWAVVVLLAHEHRHVHCPLAAHEHRSHRRFQP